MALIDLTRQAQASTTAKQVLRVSNTLNSDTGLYDVIWDTFDFEDIGTGSFDAGTTGNMQAKDLYLYDELKFPNYQP